MGFMEGQKQVDGLSALIEEEKDERRYPSIRKWLVRRTEHRSSCDT